VMSCFLPKDLTGRFLVVFLSAIVFDSVAFNGFARMLVRAGREEFEKQYCRDYNTAYRFCKRDFKPFCNSFLFKPYTRATSLLLCAQIWRAAIRRASPICFYFGQMGGMDGTRTRDLLRDREAL
jgi:hypothetical protein